MKFVNLTVTLSILSSLASGVLSASVLPRIVPPGASTPLFYLVSTSGSTAPNLLPLRLNGGSNGYTTLSGTGPIGQFYFYQGKVTALNPTGTSTDVAMIAAVPIGGGCSTYGQLGFAQSTSDKCAQYGGFQIQSDTENSQLGASLVVNFVGGFYTCGSGLDVWYKVASGDGPAGCTPIQLYTVPVIA